MRRIIGAALGCWLGVMGAAIAEEKDTEPVLVELYTSQGCSSCPPADAILAGLSARDDVIALALHVDYWDYIGWKDHFASPRYSDRQRAYARVAGVGTVYTPQMIVAGRDHLIGVRPAQLEDLIRRFRAQPSPVALDLARTGGKVRVRAEARAPLRHGAFVQLVRYTPSERVEISHGENAGRTIDYANIVTDWKKVADWDGAQALTLDLAAPGDEAVVVIIQEPGPGPVLAARQLR
ncbi:DUF1223 domain-containing protein [Defluviimonas sp. WL0024]|uniref:DUF1223 domain-containing protein n=1 Tax=Albidovulum salinarum TaxID=2984153 RepID=A0ABT2X487_9RHOB|nr:DUF1223 domain-containing protein [Defluviimonas sp. WL0024]MCU9848756.1 DUF1223 domain-containing protein [Defluviimonas sp. WL0024]